MDQNRLRQNFVSEKSPKSFEDRENRKSAKKLKIFRIAMLLKVSKKHRYFRFLAPPAGIELELIFFTHIPPAIQFVDPLSQCIIVLKTSGPPEITALTAPLAESSAALCITFTSYFILLHFPGYQNCSGCGFPRSARRAFVRVYAGSVVAASASMASGSSV